MPPIGKIVMAVIIAAVTGLLLVGLLGPILISVGIPIVETVGRFFKDWGWVIGILAGLWYFFAGGGWPGSTAVLSLVLAIALLMGFGASPVTAKAIGGTETQCNAGVGSHPGSAAMWSDPNRNYRRSAIWSGLFYCHGSGIPDLNNVLQDSGEFCQGLFGFDNGRFADCITSLEVDGVAGLDFCIYVDPNYAGNGLVFTGSGFIYQLSSTYNDRFSSARWVADGNC